MTPRLRSGGVGLQPTAKMLYSMQFRPEKPDSIVTLNRPIGVREIPEVTDNDGVDRRSLKQKTDEFKDQERRKMEREEILAEFRKSSFDHVYGFRDTGGKFFYGPKSIWPKEQALYMPNMIGKTLSKNLIATSDLLKDRISIVRLFNSRAGELQTHSFFPESPYTMAEDGFQIVHINNPEHAVNEWLVRLFSGSLKRQFTDADRYHRYLICRKGMTKSVRATISATNPLGGYLYVVDRDLKIRWAGSGVALPEERDLLWKCVNHLKAE
jgi:ATPase complex subunit ATP10